MLLKVLLWALLLFAGGASVLRASVLLENYLLLLGGMLLSLAAVLLANDAVTRQVRARARAA